jgi:hypothetical protein
MYFQPTKNWPNGPSLFTQEP